MDLRKRLISVNFCQAENHVAQLKNFETSLKTTAVDVNPYVMWLAQTCSNADIVSEMIQQVPIQCPYMFRKGKNAGHRCCQHSNHAARVASIPFDNAAREKLNNIDTVMDLLNPYCTQHRKYWNVEMEKPKVLEAMAQAQKVKRARMRDTLLLREHMFRLDLAKLKELVKEVLQTLRVLSVLDVYGVIPLDKHEKYVETLQNLLEEKQWQECFTILSATTERITNPL